MGSLVILLKLILVFLSFDLALANSGITYHGRLLSPDGTPVISSSVQFRMQIRTPGTQDCLLYEEIQTLDLSTTSGMFALSLADGSGVRQDMNSWNLFDALSNRKDFSFNAADCTGGSTYSPDPTDNRKFRVYFNDGTFPAGTWEALPVQTINYIPMSIESYAVGGFPASSLLRVETAGTLGTTTPLTSTQYSEILALVNGTSSQYEKDGELNGSSLPTISSGESVRWTGSAWQAFTPLTSETDPNVEAFAKSSLPTCATGEVLKSDGTSLSCVVDAGGWSAVDATTTVKGIVNVPTTGGLEVTSGAIGLPDVVTGGTYTKVTVDAKGRVTTGANITGSDITSGTIGGSTSISTTGSVSAASMSVRQIDLYDSDNSHHISLLTPATGDLTTNYDLVFPATLGSSNQVLGMNAAGDALENKSITAGTGVTITHSAGGIAIAATGSGGTVTSVTGTSPISVATGTTTPVISLDDAGTAGTYGSSTEVPVFTTDAKGRVTSVTETTISGVSPVGSTLATGQAWVGDGSGEAQARFIGFSDLKTSIAGNANQIPTTCSSSQVMTYSAVTDVFSCTNISITASQVSDLDVSDYVEVAGDTMTGALNLPSNGLVVGTNQLVVSGGKVGIGATVPGANLDIRDGATNAILRLWASQDSTPASDTVIQFGSKSNGTNPDDGWYLGTDGTNTYDPEFKIGFAGSAWGTPGDGDVLTIKTSGNVGIGTTNPAAKLDVAGSARATNFYSGSGTDLTVDTPQTSVPGGAGSSNYSMTVLRPNSYVFNGLKFDSSNVGSNDSKSWIAAVYNTNYSTDLRFWSGRQGNVAHGNNSALSMILSQDYISMFTGSAGATATTERLRIDSTGNVGIGTTNPSTTLEVVGTIKATAFEGPLTSTSASIGDGSAASPSMTFTNDSNTGFYSSGADSIGISAGGNQVWNITTSSIVSPTVGGGSMSNANGTASAPTFSFAGDLDTGWFRPAADTLAASTGGVERVRIDSSGNVGIGTTNPAKTFEVYGGTGLGVSDGSNGGIRLYTNGTANYIQSGTGLVGVSTRDLYFGGMNVSGANMMISATGKVGIGTSTPSQELHIASGSNAQIVIQDMSGVKDVDSHHASIQFQDSLGAATAYMGLNTAGQGFGIVNNNATGKLSFGTAASTRMTIDSTGNVGIGTTSPHTSLDVVGGRIRVQGQGSIDPSDTSAGLELLYSGAHSAIQSYDRATSSYLPMRMRSSQFEIYTEDSERMRIDATGKVGIGTTNPETALSIYGASVSGKGLLYVNGTDHGFISTNAPAAGATGIAFSKDGNSPTWTMGLDSNDTNYYISYGGAVGANQRLAITTSGNVGIGTTIPSTLLNVRDVTPGTVAKVSMLELYRDLGAAGDIGGVRQSLSLDFKLTDANGINKSQIRSESGWNSTYADNSVEGESMSQLVFATSDTTSTLVDRMVISGNGNVGIGSAAPNYTLDVVGQMGLTGHIYGGRNDSPTVIMGSSGNSNYLGLYGGPNLNDSAGVLFYGNTHATAPGRASYYSNTETSDTTVAHVFYKRTAAGANTSLMNIRTNGDMYVYGSATTCTIGNGSGGTSCSSDERLKDNITPIENSLDKILSINGVEFDWNEKSKSPGTHAIGVIAQDVEQVFPTAVMENPDSGYKSVDYSVLVAPLIESTKEIYGMCKSTDERVQNLSEGHIELKRRLASVEEENQKIRLENAELKARLKRIEAALGLAK